MGLIDFLNALGEFANSPATLNKMENNAKAYGQRLESQKRAAERHGGLNDEQLEYYEQQRGRVDDMLDKIEERKNRNNMY